MIDQVKIILAAGKGGDGAISFRREKYVPKGGPDGGDGGKGGSIYIETEPNETTLKDFTQMQLFKAGDGGKGGGAKMSGKKGEDLVLKVPLGTVIRLTPFDEAESGNRQVAVSGMGRGASGTLIEQPREKKSEEIVIDFDEPNKTYLVAKGGKGGRGNVHFKSSTNTTPRQAIAGQKGESFEVFMELKLLADVGLIGLPNAGKSTLLSVLSNAKPKIADYAFTTIEPNMGVMKHKGVGVVIADIPGLIEGASEGKGLGIQFLKHVERTKVLVHLVAATEEGEVVYQNYKTVREELKKYSPELAKKKEVVVVSKIDLVDEEALAKIQEVFKKHKIKVRAISAGQMRGVDNLKDEIMERSGSLR